MPGQSISPVLTDAASVQDFGPGGILNQLPGLKATGDVQRLTLTTINQFREAGNQYSATNPAAISDGDNQGRGENSGQVGTLIDQLTQNQLTYASGNKYKPGDGYDNFDFPQQHW